MPTFRRIFHPIIFSQPSSFDSIRMSTVSPNDQTQGLPSSLASTLHDQQTSLALRPKTPRTPSECVFPSIPRSGTRKRRLACVDEGYEDEDTKAEVQLCDAVEQRLESSLLEISVRLLQTILWWRLREIAQQPGSLGNKYEQRSWYVDSREESQPPRGFWQQRRMQSVVRIVCLAVTFTYGCRMCFNCKTTLFIYAPSANKSSPRHNQILSSSSFDISRRASCHK